MTRMAANLVIHTTDSRPLVQMTAREFMFGYSSNLVTIGNTLLPSWIKFDKVGLIDRVSGQTVRITEMETEDSA